MATTLVVRTDLSGTSFVLDVSALELNPSLSILDFEVTHNGVPIATYAKTSSTQLTYTGTSVVLGTKIVARRLTSLVQSETTFLSTTTASALTNALEKERLRIDELDARLTYALAQVAAGGISLGAIPVNNTAYGVSWSGDTTNAPSKNATYNIIQTKADANNATLTGNATSATTPANTSNSTAIANTAFVVNRATSRLVFINSNSPSQSLTSGSLSAFTGLTGVTRSGYGDSFASGVLTLGTSGVYRITMNMSFGASGSTITDTVLSLYVNSTDNILSRTAAVGGVQFINLSGSYVGTFSAGNTLAARAYCVFPSGTLNVVLTSFTVEQLS